MILKDVVHRSNGMNPSSHITTISPMLNDIYNHWDARRSGQKISSSLLSSSTSADPSTLMPISLSYALASETAFRLGNAASDSEWTYIADGSTVELNRLVKSEKADI